MTSTHMRGFASKLSYPLFSLRNLCVLYVFVVRFAKKIINHRETEDAAVGVMAPGQV